MQPNN